MDNPQDFQAEDDAPGGPPMPTQAELETVLDASDSDVAAGRIVALAPVLARMRAIAKRIRQQRAAPSGKPQPHA